jgi:hypothetical protein
MKKILRLLLSILYTLLIFPVLAGESALILIDKHQNFELSIESLRKQANVEFRLFSPFRGHEVQVRGILLESLLEQHLSRVPDKIKFIARDGYAITFEHWQPNHWFIITHENGEPLSLRQQGPLRVVERNSRRDPTNLRNFNDWIWMLQKIEILP